MIDIDEINNTIEQLEQSDTTFSNCSKLASLYIVRDNLKTRSEPLVSSKNEVIKEIDDILPQYKMYLEVKRRYQLQEMTQDAVVLAMKDVCKEIEDFMQVLYSSTDMQEERNLIHELTTKLQSL